MGVAHCLSLNFRNGGPVVIVKEPIPDDWTYLVIRKNCLKNEKGGVLFAGPGEVEFSLADYLQFRLNYYWHSRDHLNSPFSEQVEVAMSIKSPIDERYLRAAYTYCWEDRKTTGEILDKYDFCHFGGLR